MSRLSDLIAKVKAKDPALGQDLDEEVKALSSRRPFGLNFERHQPESVELPGRPVRKGDKVRILPPRGATAKGDQRLWSVAKIETSGGQKTAVLELDDPKAPEQARSPVEDLVVVAEFKDFIYPGLVSTGKVERGGEKPFHTVINGENYHALEALTFTHRGKIDVIYIDPPYNTGAKDWKYNNDYVGEEDLYRHSKWLAFLERRLLVARELLAPASSALIVTIDEKEYLRLGLLLEQIFPDSRIQMISSAINPAAQARAGSFARIDEYIFVVMRGNIAPARLMLSRDWVSSKGRTHTGTARWDLLRRSGTAAQRKHSPGGFFPIYVDPVNNTIVEIGNPLAPGISKAGKGPNGSIAVLPIRKDGSEGRWQVAPETLRSYHAEGRVKVGGNREKGFAIYYLKPGEWQKVLSGEYNSLGIGSDGSLLLAENDSPEEGVLAIPSTQWSIPSHDATQYGSRLLIKVIPQRRFPFPKSLYAVEDVLRFFTHPNKSAIVLDFFAGSGTTAHAIMRLNRQDSGLRQCISVTNNEVAAEEQSELRQARLRPGDPDWEKWGICDYITKPRIKAAITGKTPEGKDIEGDYKFTDEFPMADGFQENAEFFTLTYETPVAVSHNRAFERIAPLLWMRAGSEGRRIDKLPKAGFEVADTYGLLTEVDKSHAYVRAVKAKKSLRIAFIVTDDERRFQAIARKLPEGVEPVRLYESYLTNFRFSMGR